MMPLNTTTTGSVVAAIAKPTTIGSSRPHTPRRITWTPFADSRLTNMSDEGASLRAMASAFGLSRTAVANRGIVLGLFQPSKPAASQTRTVNPDPFHDPSRASLPAGHPTSWGLITSGTCLEGCPYPDPTSLGLCRRAVGADQ